MTHHHVDRAARLAAMRRSYELGGLGESDLAAGWLAQLEGWLDDAGSGGVLEPNAMVLATAGPAGAPSTRMVLLKALDARGLVFYTGYGSRKARDLECNPRASLTFPWHELQRQVHVEGAAERVGAAESDAYWASRPRGSQIGALASHQSEPVADRGVLEAARDAAAARHPEDAPVPRPERWGGYRVVPDLVEFWQGRPDRLHDRLRYRLAAGEDRWIVERLAP